MVFIIPKQALLDQCKRMIEKIDNANKEEWLASWKVSLEYEISRNKRRSFLQWLFRRPALQRPIDYDRVRAWVKVATRYGPQRKFICETLRAAELAEAETIQVKSEELGELGFWSSPKDPYDVLKEEGKLEINERYEPSTAEVIEKETI